MNLRSFLGFFFFKEWTGKNFDDESTLIFGKNANNFT
jgi:hypothetical protein